MRISAIAIFILGLVVSGAASAADAPRVFIKKAIEGNLAETQMGTLAAQRGTTSMVRSYGRRLMRDHGDANVKAMRVARRLGVSPPVRPNAEQRAAYKHMRSLLGREFDREFVTHMIADHQKAISDYRPQARSRAATARYAAEALPTLRQHLQTARNLSARVDAER